MIRPSVLDGGEAQRRILPGSLTARATWRRTVVLKGKKNTPSGSVVRRRREGLRCEGPAPGFVAVVMMMY